MGKDLGDDPQNNFDEPSGTHTASQKEREESSYVVICDEVLNAALWDTPEITSFTWKPMYIMKYNEEWEA